MGDVLVPILKDTRDPHYRYKMPKLTAKVEGSGNGIKTVITNMSAIAKALNRPASYPTKYFGCELGAQVTMNNDYIVNGSHDADKLLNLLYAFIRKFVLCTKCNNPETSLIISNQTIRQKCIACGHESTIPKTIHKLTTYIINHPPEGNSNSAYTSTTTTITTKGKSSKGKKDKKSSSNNGNGNGSPTNSHDSGNDLNGKENSNENDGFSDFDDDALTADAYAERMRQLTTGFSSGMHLNDPKESANVFYKLVKDKKEAGQIMDSNVQKELVKEAERLEIKDKAVLILCELLFTENIVDEIKANRLLLLRFCYENKKAQKYLLGGFEKLVGDVYKDKLLNSVSKILKQFYDEDIIEEEVLLEWAAKESKKYVSKETSKKIHEKAGPFVKWLKEAEVEEDSEEEEKENTKQRNGVKEMNEKNGIPSKQNGGQQNGTNSSAPQRRQSLEDDDEEDEDDLEQVEFSHKVQGVHIEVVKPNAVPKAVNADVTVNSGDQAEDDIDIDNI